jgi:hypothetical protein
MTTDGELREFLKKSFSLMPLGEPSILLKKLQEQTQIITDDNELELIYNIFSVELNNRLKSLFERGIFNGEPTTLDELSSKLSAYMTRIDTIIWPKNENYIRAVVTFIEEIYEVLNIDILPS